MPNKLEIIINADGTRAIRSLKEVAATAAATGKETAQAAKLAELARKFEADTITSTSVKIIQARRNEVAAATDYRKVQQQVRDGALSEAEGITLEAAAYQKLAAARLHAAEAARVEKSTGLNSVFRERVTEHLGEFGITESMAGMTAAVVGGVAVLGELANKMREVVSEGLEYGEMMQRASEKTGLAVETLSVLHYATKLTGGDFDGTTTAITKFDTTIGKAAQGNKQAGAFVRALGLDAKDLANRGDGAEIAWKKFTETVGAIENPITRTTVATAMLGRAGAEQIPTLVQLATHWDEYSKKAEETGNKMSGQTARQLAETNEKLKQLSQSIAGASISFTEGFAPAFSKMLDVMAGGESHLELFKSWGDGTARTLATLAGLAYEYGAALKWVQAAQLSLVPFMGDKARAAFTESSQMDAKGRKYADIAFGDSTEGGLQPYAGKTVNGKIVTEKPGGGKPPGFTLPPLGGGEGGADHAAQARLKQMEADLAAEKLQYGMSIKAVYDFWDARRNAFAAGSDQYNSIVEKQASLAEEGAKQSAGIVKRFKDEQLRNQISGDRELEQAMRDGNRVMLAIAKDRYEGQEEQRKGAERVYLEQMDGRDRMREFQLGMDTAGDSARGVAAIHQMQVQREMQSLAGDRTKAAQDPFIDEQQRQRQIAAIDEQIARLETDARLRDAEDQKRIESTTLMGGASDALRDFIRESTDAGAAMRRWVSGSLNATNDALVRAMTGDKANFREVGHEIFTNAAGGLLKNVEGNAMKALFGNRFGLGAKADGSEANPLYVKLAGTGQQGSMSDFAKVLGIGLPGVPESKGGSEEQGGGGLIGKLLGKLFHGGGSGDDSEGDGGDGGVGGIFGKVFGGLLGGGGGKHDGSSPSAALYVQQSGGSAGGGMPGGMDLGSLFGGDGGDSGGDGGGGGFGALISGMGSLFGGMAMPAFADGTDFAPGGPSLVGERGPEIVNMPRGAQVTPNNKLGGGDTHTHTYNIDARGATDPSATEEAIHRAMASHGAAIENRAVARIRDEQSRAPRGRSR
jgi:hypothetical protein